MLTERYGNGLAEPGSASSIVTGTGGPLVGDLNGDGFVGINDLNTVLGNWNAGAPPQAGTGHDVPEPGTLLVFTSGVVALIRRRVSGDAAA